MYPPCVTQLTDRVINHLLEDGTSKISAPTGRQPCGGLLKQHRGTSPRVQNSDLPVPPSSISPWIYTTAKSGAPSWVSPAD